MKDAKGHGSDPRGGKGPDSPEVAAHMKRALANAAKFGPDHPSVGAAMHDAIMAARPAGGFYKIASSTPDPAYLAKFDQSYGLKGGTKIGDTPVPGKTLGTPAPAAAGGQPVASNAHAAATLASGSKSAPVDVHPAQRGGADSLIQGAYAKAHGFGPGAKRELKNSGM
jgi:hypothetical protein